LQGDACSGTPLAGGATCDVVLRHDYKGTALAGGTPSSGLLTAKADPGTQAQATLSGTALANSDGPILTPSHYTYPPAKVGTTGESLSYTFSLLYGSAPVTVTSVNASLPDFVIVDDGCTGKVVHGGDRCPIVVAFRPTAVGQHDGVLTLGYHHDPCGDHSLKVDLRGGGTP
jgi:hypothetical protein